MPKHTSELYWQGWSLSRLWLQLWCYTLNRCSPVFQKVEQRKMEMDGGRQDFHRPLERSWDILERCLAGQLGKVGNGGNIAHLAGHISQTSICNYPPYPAQVKHMISFQSLFSTTWFSTRWCSVLSLNLVVRKLLLRLTIGRKSLKRNHVNRLPVNGTPSFIIFLYLGGILERNLSHLSKKSMSFLHHININHLNTWTNFDNTISQGNTNSRKTSPQNVYF